jgi:hypothetical protein
MPNSEEDRHANRSEKSSFKPVESDKFQIGPRIVVLQVHLAGIKVPVLEGKGPKLNLVLLSDLHSLDLFKGQPVSGSIINPGGRRTGMSGDPLRDLDGAARIHVFGNPPFPRFSWNLTSACHHVRSNRRPSGE